MLVLLAVVTVHHFCPRSWVSWHEGDEGAAYGKKEYTVE